MMKNNFKLVGALALCLLAASCSTTTWQNINYLQDVQNDTSMTMAVNKGIIIQPQDQLSILVTSSSPSMASIFNKTVVGQTTSSEMNTANSGTNRIVGYTVDNDGYISFPQLGMIHAAGMNRWELQSLIEEQLINDGLLKDANVTVEFLNFKISVLGEVTSPGTYNVTGDKITIFQALALAHDLTIYGQRSNLMVIREQNGERKIYTLDPRSSEIFQSPAYYLQQNDVVYATPNQVRAGQSTINENYFKSGSFWVSMGSMAITVVNLVITLLRR